MGQMLHCDQAVFTSIRSLGGEGYRIIAASPGVSADEKAEITRRSPSHGSLVGTGPAGLVTYLLRSGRHCVAYCCHAGTEHTGRGGQRVYSHIILMDRDGYRRLNADPVRVHAALGRILSRQGPILKPPPRLEPLSLDCPDAEAVPRAEDVTAQPERSPEWIWTLARDILNRQRLVFVGAADPLCLLEWALLSLPCHLRERVDASVGLRFSSARDLQVVLLPESDLRLVQQIAGQGIVMYQADQSAGDASRCAHPWFRLLQRWWTERRLHRVLELTSSGAGTTARDRLDRIAALCERLDRLERQGPDAPRDDECGRSIPSAATDVERRLIAQIERLHAPAA
jgi:hypothetical protein